MIKLLVWLMLLYSLVVIVEVAVAAGWVDGAGAGRDGRLGDVDDVDRERVDVTMHCWGRAYV